MSDLTKRLCRPGYDLQKEQAVQEAIIEITRLRAKIEAMEKQEPAGTLHDDGYFVWSPRCRPASNYVGWKTKLYTLPVAQPAPIEQDTSVRKAWARFSNELHRSPDAPYPGMADAFERHFSQSFTDREWRAESATWAAAWKAAKNHGAQAQPAPSVPEITVEMEHAFYEKVTVTRVGSIVGLAEGIKAAMLAAAPEAKS